MVDVFMEMIKVELSNIEKNTTGAETGKLIMLVSDFYYGRHEGNFDDEKTYTTFKCFSCLKVLKNNIRYVNISISTWKLSATDVNIVFPLLCHLRKAILTFY